MGQKTLEIDSAGSETTSVLLDTSVFIYYLEGVEPYYHLTEEISEQCSIVSELTK